MRSPHSPSDYNTKSPTCQPEIQIYSKRFAAYIRLNFVEICQLFRPAA